MDRDKVYAEALGIALVAEPHMMGTFAAMIVVAAKTPEGWRAFLKAMDGVRLMVLSQADDEAPTTPVPQAYLDAFKE